MDTKKKIEQNLRAAPKPAPPDGLLNRLKKDVSVEGIEMQHPALRRWFAPAGGTVSPLRIAAAAIIAIMILMPLTYAGGKIIKNYIFTEGPKVEVTENEDGSVTKSGSISVSIASDDSSSEEEVKAARKEIDELRKAGKYERTFVKEWEDKGMTFTLYKVSYTLSNGKVITVNEIEGSSSSGSTGQ